ncbi:terminase small subunit protein [Rhizobium phage RHph_TM3_3_9]|nr:terminase small subunit protein [Rhizobium phage RHph_TM3_3_9]QIG68603.1 terminase small subunit protein [Rhizobium phage RHph_TM3_3_13]QIG74461.1 terminase small subunit protein [Rhizobium phage RHph_TM3_3_10]QXV74575.1 terminase small subunit protein [Rhizobium phage RHEph19]
MLNLPGVTPEPPERDEEDDELSPRRQRFVDEYIKDFNATRAARVAGYSDEYAGQVGHRLLTLPVVRSAVRKAKAAFLEEQAGEPITKDWVLARLLWIAQANVADIAEWGPDLTERKRKDGTIEVMNGVQLVPSIELPKHVTYAITEISQGKEGVKFKLGDKRAALDSIAKILGMVTEKIDHSGKVETVVSNGPDLSTMTDAQLVAWEAFLVASAEAKAVTIPDDPNR